MTRAVRALIADDSVVYRSQIRAALGHLPGLEVVGAVANGKFALDRLVQRDVDLLVLDMEMPELDGLGTLAAMAAKGLRCKTLVFSSVTKHGAEITLEALRLGASDFIAKPGSEQADSNPAGKIRALLEPKVLALFPGLAARAPLAEAVAPEGGANFPRVIWDLFQPKVIVIGSSTGGPSMLEKIFSELDPTPTCPILIAQHMPPIFTATLAARLKKVSGIEVREGAHGIPLKCGEVYLAPGDYHMSIAGTRVDARIVLDQGPLINYVRPAVDPLFSSAAAVFGDRCLGIVLTGMGADGKAGSEIIKRSGGAVLIQSESSCVVFGMPGAVKSAGAYDLILEPAGIVSALLEKSGATRKSVVHTAVGRS